MTFLSFLGTLKSRNEDITSDALRIASLEAALKTARDEAARAIVSAALWEGRCERLLASKEYTTGVRRLAAIAKYRRGRA